MKGHVESRYKLDPEGRAKFSSGGNVLTGAGATGGESCKPWRGFDPASKGRHWAVPSFYEDLMDAAYLELNSTEKLEALYSAGLIEIVPGNAWPVMVRYLEERDGTPLGDIWAYQPYTNGTVWGTSTGIDEDVKWLGPTDPERMGYPTQKPISLLERIIITSSNPGDLVLDPFCGCGTTVHAAQKLGRRWIGIDVTHVAIGLIEVRLRSAFKDATPPLQYQVHGTPMDLDAARDFFLRDDKTKKEFEKWAVAQIGFLPQTKKGADGGFDGMVWFGPKEDRKAVVSVKGGKTVNVEMVRSLDAVVTAQKADVGVLLSLEEPTAAAKDWARQGGLFELPGFRPVSRLQLVTVEEAMARRERAVDLPTRAAPVKSAPKEAQKGAVGDLFGP